MSFLGQLSDQLNSQLSLGENSNHSLDSVINGQNVKYGSLGDFAKNIDLSADRKYVEEGYLRQDPYNASPKGSEILMQTPNATVFIKKRMFSSIAENFRPDFMDADEKLYFKTIKVLFANKCAQISALEKLSKIQNITSKAGNVSDALIPIILGLSDTISAGGVPGDTSFTSAFGGNPLGGSDATKLLNVTDQLRKIYSFNSTSNTTNWVVDNSDLFQSTLGSGTGVIEITNFTGLTTNCSVDSIKNSQSFSLNIVDPYSSMLITEWDIEKAISDATNMFTNSSIFPFANSTNSDNINTLQNSLNELRDNRGASAITINIDPNTLLGKRVTAILDTGNELLFTYNSESGFLGNGVTVASDYLQGGAVLGQDGLSSSELLVFGNLITAIFTKIQLDSNSQNAFQTSNSNTNYARRKMRFNFLGKLIIQPMDTVHIYISSQSVWDNKVLGGLNNMFTGFGLTQSLNIMASNINSLTALLDPQSSQNLQAEKAAYVGADFPDYLWNLLRSQFINENQGTHVFAGIVDSARSSWSDGSFNVSINGRDNTAYFDQGKVNFKPGVDVFNGAIYDPLTPFKSNFDTISSNTKDNTPELLEENKVILGTSLNKKGLLKAKSGPDVGRKVANDHFTPEATIDTTTGTISRVLHAPDGLVYKWKEGIGVFVQFGSSLDLNDPNKTGNPNIYKNPFAGQDIMNVLSLLITGKPYNYANYWKTVYNLYGFGSDPQSKQDASHVYTASLQNELTKNNALWGNFIPFKNLVIDEASFAKAQSSQFRIVQRNDSIDKKLQQYQNLQNQAQIFGAANALTNIPTVSSSQLPNIMSQIDALKASIQSDIDQINKDDAAFNANAPSAGTDASFDYSENINSSKTGTAPSDSKPRQDLRRQVNYLTKRMSYNVRANEDKNFFIVDDTYDKDYDILAYTKDLIDGNGIGLYNNEFLSIRDNIKNTAVLLNLEVFADTQGHIRVRSPQYNRMPSSVFYRMMYLKSAYGIQIFPQFLSDLFTDQITTLRERLEILEDLIRLDCAIALGTSSPGQDADSAATSFILQNGTNGNTSGSFAFFSTPDDNIIDYNQVLKSTNPDTPDGQNAFFLGLLQGQTSSNKETFTNTSRYLTILNSVTAKQSNTQGYSVYNVPSFNANSYIDQLISRIQTKSGQKISKKDYITTDIGSANGFVLSAASSIDIFKVTKELQEKLQERQKVVRLLYGAIKNAVEYKSLDDNNSTTATSMLSPSLYNNANIPPVFQHMIEDETYDDYGPNSGQRYVIKNSQIINLDIAENPPEMTMVEVTGVLNQFGENLPTVLNSFPNGNGLVTAVAVDYDAWRNYGFKNEAPIKVPFLSDPNTQCAPYASMILSLNRKNILRGSVTISGNEFMQPGEVVYLIDRGLLFYVTAVRHNFTFNNQFHTTLDLSYGHSPGDYIPTPLDVIGKILYNNRDIAGYTIQRQSSSANETNMGVVQLDPNTGDSGLPDVPNDNNENPNAPQSTFGSTNSSVLQNILFQAAYLVNSNNTAGNNVQAQVELRIYHDNDNSINSNLQSFANQIMNVLTGTAGLNTTSTSSFTSQPFDASSVKIVTVNIDDDTEHRSPSQKAIDSARNQTGNSTLSINLDRGSSDSTTPIASNDQIRKMLFGYIVDCWLSFNNVSTTTTTGGN